MTTDHDYDALLVVSFGGPEGPADVDSFLDNVFRGLRVPATVVVIILLSAPAARHTNLVLTVGPYLWKVPRVGYEFTGPPRPSPAGNVDRLR